MDTVQKINSTSHKYFLNQMHDDKIKFKGTTVFTEQGFLQSSAAIEKVVELHLSWK